MPYRGFYINLDRSTDRREAMVAQLLHLGLADRYRRVVAVDGRMVGPSGALSASEHGCFLSHLRVLRRGICSEVPLHVLEDDAVLAGCAGQVLAQIAASPLLAEHDLLFTDMTMPVDLKLYRAARMRWEGQPLPGVAGERVFAFSLLPYYACMSSYLINPSSAGKVVGLLEAALAAGPDLPVDLTIHRLVSRGELRAACLFPFVTGGRPGAVASTIDRPANDLVADTVMDVIRHSFFVEADEAATMALLDRLLGVASGTFHDRLFRRLGGYMTSCKFPLD